jgi:Bacterial protein of unknown function (DUF885)
VNSATIALLICGLALAQYSTASDMQDQAAAHRRDSAASATQGPAATPKRDLAALAEQGPGAAPMRDPTAPAATHDRLMRLAEEITHTSARLFPTQATALGITRYDAELETPSELARAAYIELLRAWRKRLRAIVPAGRPGVSLLDADDARLLDAQLQAGLNALLVYGVDRKNFAAGAVNIVNTIFLQLQFLPVAGRDGATQASVDRAWSDIAQRLSKVPAYIAAAERLATTPGHLFGIVGSQVLDGAPDLFARALTEAAKLHYGADAAALAGFFKGRDAALAAIARSKATIDAHAASWPENFSIGRAAFDRMLREEQLLPFDSREIELLSADELAHGWAEEAWLRSLAQHEARSFGPASGGGLAPGGAALIPYYRARIAELETFVRERDIVTVPPWLGVIEVVENPPFMQPVSPGASMNSPRPLAPESKGYYFITPPTSLAEAAARLDMNEDFDRDRILSTAAHEAMPGHFLQLSIAKRHPDFVRRIQQSTVFEEGWAYYGEEMFVRLGLFGADLDPRLFTAQWERVRGARGIVDSKLASGEWTYRQAADFYARESGFTQTDADAAVAGFATNPGSGIVYTAGRLQLQQLLAIYLQKTAGRGSLHDFHDRLLSYGSVPFVVLAPELLADLSKPASAVRAAANY